MSNIGNRIKELRNYENIKQIDFAKRVLVSSSYISKVEAGKETPSNIFIKLVALEFGISYEWLKDGTGNMNITDDKHDYFERNEQYEREYLPECLNDFMNIIQNLIEKENNFRLLNINGVLFELSGVLNVELSDSKKDLLLEIVASYIGEFNEFINKLKDIENKSDPWEDIANYYMNSAMKTTKNLLSDTIELYTNPK